MIANEDNALVRHEEALTRLWNILRWTGWAAVPVLLLIPAVAMRFTTGVEWTTLDFMFGGGVLTGAGLILEVVAWTTRKPAIRFGAAFVVLALVGLIWASAVA